MKVLAIDTETTGLPKDYNALVTESSKWPHIIQLSFILLETRSKQILDYSDRIIKLSPDVEISPDSIAIHQITRQRSDAAGIPIHVALMELRDAMKEADIIIGHNLIFDKKMVLVELNRQKMPNYFINSVGNSIKEYCTMRETVDLCKLPSAVQKYANQYKWPRLNELHKHLFQTEPSGTHNAIADVMICLRCYVFINCKYDIATDDEVKMVFRSLYANYCLGALPPDPRSVGF
jgi:DNA polymerase-3 subunit epsilon